MILISILIHKLGHYLPSWIGKEKFKVIRTKFRWKQILFEMGGAIANFLIAFIIILIITFTTKGKYLPNENAIHGIEFGAVMEDMGFVDGDKFTSINNKPISRFSDILESILLPPDNVSIKIIRDDEIKEITLTDIDKQNIITSGKHNLIRPRLRHDTTAGMWIDDLEYKEKSQGLKESLQTFDSSIKYLKRTFLPKNTGYKSVASFSPVGEIKDLKGFLMYLAITSILVGLINLLPIPGFDVGNAIIAIIEKIRNEKFNSKKLKMIRIISVSVFLIIFVSNFMIKSW